MMELAGGKMAGTLGREVISTRQRKIAELAQREPKLTLTTLAHHIDEVWMREAYRRVRKDAAPGVDGVTAAQYEAELEANLSGLLERFKSGGYRAPAVRRVHLEKPGTSKTRPIGIPTLDVGGCEKPRINGEHKIWGLTSGDDVFSQIGRLVAGSSLPAMNTRCVRTLGRVTRRAGAQRRSREEA